MEYEKKKIVDINKKFVNDDFFKKKLNPRTDTGRTKFTGKLELEDDYD